MEDKSLVTFISNYVRSDKTKSAIMLTGSWGTGKSYFIQNKLIPSFEKDEEKIRCVTISLYGLESLSDISRSIYLQLRFQRKKKEHNCPLIKKIHTFFSKLNKEATTLGKVAGKTIITGLLGKAGVSLSVSEKDLNSIFSSIDLTNCLIVLEDLERSNMDIVSILGYVNNLVEQDGAKVLLVANEDEILKRYNSDDENSDSAENSYLRVKEKTINDTILYEQNLQSAIPEIISSFKNQFLIQLSDEKTVQEICDIMQTAECHNLRVFLFACQKVVDIYKFFDELPDVDKNLRKTILLSVLSFSLKLKTGKNISWESNNLVSGELGEIDYPLLKVCYTYIMYHKYNAQLVKSCIDSLKDYWLFETTYRSTNDSDLTVLYNFYEHNEKAVIQVLGKIESRLKSNEEDISFYEFGKIAFYSIWVSEILNYNIDGIETALVNNLKGKMNKIHPQNIFRIYVTDESNGHIKERYETLRHRMIRSLKADECVIFGFNYDVSQLAKFLEFAYSKEHVYLTDNAFISKFDVEKLAKMYCDGSAKQRQKFRSAFGAVYAERNVKQFYPDDIKDLKRFCNLLKQNGKSTTDDRIAQYQCDLFISDLYKYYS